MRSLFIVAVPLLASLAACGGTDDTSPGTLDAVHNTGGFCDETAAWCGWDLALDGDQVTITSKSATGTALGTLTADGRAELDALVAALPIDATADTTLVCEDAANITLDITFDHGGAHAYSYTCDAGPFSDLAVFVGDISNALIGGTADARIDIDESDSIAR